MSNVTLDQQIAELRREIAWRTKVYPRLISEKKLRQSAADRCLAHIRAALATLINVKENQRA